jgi:small subunit ribosomal protein S15
MTQTTAVKIVKDFGKNGKDWGNSRVQIALLTHRIAEITEHLKVHKKDKHSRRGLTTLVAQRRRLLNYLTRTDLEGYRALIKQLDLRR